MQINFLLMETFSSFLEGFYFIVSWFPSSLASCQRTCHCKVEPVWIHVQYQEKSTFGVSQDFILSSNHYFNFSIRDKLNKEKNKFKLIFKKIFSLNQNCNFKKSNVLLEYRQEKTCQTGSYQRYRYNIRASHILFNYAWTASQTGFKRSGSNAFWLCTLAVKKDIPIYGFTLYNLWVWSFGVKFFSVR